MPKIEIDGVEDGGNFQSLSWAWSAMMRKVRRRGLIGDGVT
jgi:hypothetical protein